MRVWMLAAKRGGCPYYRQRQPARVVAEDYDFEITVAEKFAVAKDEEGNMIPSVNDAAVRGVVEPIEADVAVLGRPVKRTMLELLQAFQANGVAVVVDVDDDFSSIHPANSAAGILNPKANPNENTKILQEACRLADLVTVTTEPLAERYGAHGRVEVIPNCVPAALLEMPSIADGSTLGWAGEAGVHPGDLETTHGGVAEALRRVDWRFRVVGPGDLVADRLGLEQLEATGFIEQIDAYQQILGTLDVGIVPLESSRFNRAKSYLKGLEYAARGVPFVASPLPEYERLAQSGVGLIAGDRARNWRQQLVRLMTDTSLHNEMAEAAQEVVAERHTFEGEGWRWAEAWEKAAVNRRVPA